MIQDLALILSPYYKLYDIVVGKDHILRKIKELVDFSFVDEKLAKYYTLDLGRPGYLPQMMFKYLFLKVLYKLSDRDVVERAKTDLAFKYFLGLAPEDDVIDPSTLTKFRKLRLKDDSILNDLIKETIKIALKNGIILSNTMIVDSTHTICHYGQKTAREYLLELCKSLRKDVYKANEDYSGKMPAKPDSTKIGLYENVVEYCQEVVNLVKQDEQLMIRNNIKERVNLLEETITDVNEELMISKDPDAKAGHKTADSEYFGYKTHIGMTPERIIVAATVTSGEKPDGKEVEALVNNSNENGVKIEAISGDGAYSEKDNIEYANKNDIKLVSKLSKAVLSGSRRNPLDDQFSYNKDAQMYVCPQGHMAIKKTTSGLNDVNKPTRESYYFDIDKCKNCPLRDKCGFKEGQKSKTYNVTVEMSSIHYQHQENQETEEYKNIAKERYKIEAKNAELKNQHGYSHTTYTGLHGMTLQASVSIFVVNIKRILTLKNEKKVKNKA